MLAEMHPRGAVGSPTSSVRSALRCRRLSQGQVQGPGLDVCECPRIWAGRGEAMVGVSRAEAGRLS